MKRSFSRRDFMRISGVAAGAGLAARYWPSHGFAAGAVQAPDGSPRAIADGPFKPTWESLAAQYKCPEWFRDAKFGIWAHWSAQCVPEQGDWYARRMYSQGEPMYEHHLKTYGHPTKSGFMEIDNLWKAENWEPEKLVALYKRAGAKYFFALANHHDNFDTYDSKYHAWNSTRIGPKKDIIGTWAKAIREAGLRFGVSNHSGHSWHWFQTAYGYDAEGPHAGERYDAATLTKEEGKGKWWEGLDPQELYTGPNMKAPDGIKTIAEMAAWQKKNTAAWNENPPPNNPEFVRTWFLRCQDLMDKYQPDVVYFDNNELPLGQAGLDIAAHYYNSSLKWHAGNMEVLITGKHMLDAHRPALVEDIERSVAKDIRPQPWQTDTCIGQWHYSGAVAEQNKYKTVAQVVSVLVDIVSKNGNLMLSIPVRGDGTIDEKEHAFLEGMAAWMGVNGDGIFGSRPWKISGEGPTPVSNSDSRPAIYTGADFRFTTKGGSLYAYAMGWPGDKGALIKSLATGSPQMAGGRKVTGVSLLGYEGKLEWSQNEQGLAVKLPEKPPSEHATALKIEGVATL